MVQPQTTTPTAACEVAKYPPPEVVYYGKDDLPNMEAVREAIGETKGVIVTCENGINRSKMLAPVLVQEGVPVVNPSIDPTFPFPTDATKREYLGISIWDLNDRLKTMPEGIVIDDNGRISVGGRAPFDTILLIANDKPSQEKEQFTRLVAFALDSLQKAKGRKCNIRIIFWDMDKNGIEEFIERNGITQVPE